MKLYKVPGIAHGTIAQAVYNKVNAWFYTVDLADLTFGLYLMPKTCSKAATYP